MTPDSLDDLLDRSAPAPRAIDDRALTAMIADARHEVPRGRKRRGALVAGALTLVLAGGAGVATATDGFTWAPWLQDPIGAYALTLPSGLECEVRIAQYEMPGNPVATADINRIVEDMWRSTDVLAAGDALLPEMIANIRSAARPEGDPGLSADWEHYYAWMHAIGELEIDALAAHGYALEDGRLAGLEGGQAIQCFDADGEATIP